MEDDNFLGHRSCEEPESFTPPSQAWKMPDKSHLTIPATYPLPGDARKRLEEDLERVKALVADGTARVRVEDLAGVQHGMLVSVDSLANAVDENHSSVATAPQNESSTEYDDVAEFPSDPLDEEPEEGKNGWVPYEESDHTPNARLYPTERGGAFNTQFESNRHRYCYRTFGFLYDLEKNRWGIYRHTDSDYKRKKPLYVWTEQNPTGSGGPFAIRVIALVEKPLSLTGSGPILTTEEVMDAQRQAFDAIKKVLMQMVDTIEEGITRFERGKIEQYRVVSGEPVLCDEDGQSKLFTVATQEETARCVADFLRVRNHGEPEGHIGPPT